MKKLSYKSAISKSAFVAEMRKHQAADAFLKGTYGKEDGNFRGCAVGCGVRSIRVLVPSLAHTEYFDHSALANALNWPEWLIRLEDKLFEMMSTKRTKTWPVEIAEAIPEGVDLTPALPKVMLAILVKARAACPKNNPESLRVVDRVIALWSRSDLHSKAVAEAATETVVAAVWAAETDAEASESWATAARAEAEAAAEAVRAVAVWAAETAEAVRAVEAEAAVAEAAAETAETAVWAAETAAAAEKDPERVRSLCAESIADAVLKAVKECRTV